MSMPCADCLHWIQGSEEENRVLDEKLRLKVQTAIKNHDTFQRGMMTSMDDISLTTIAIIEDTALPVPTEDLDGAVC